MQVPGLGNVPALPMNATAMISEADNEPFDVPPLPQARHDGHAVPKFSRAPRGTDMTRLDNGQARLHNEGLNGEAKGSEEQQVLHSSNFNAKAFISKSLSGATDTEISKFADK